MVSRGNLVTIPGDVEKRWWVEAAGFKKNVSSGNYRSKIRISRDYESATLDFCLPSRTEGHERKQSWA